jgi:hypothetical protein
MAGTINPQVYTDVCSGMNYVISVTNVLIRVKLILYLATAGYTWPTRPPKYDTARHGGVRHDGGRPHSRAVPGLSAMPSRCHTTASSLSCCRTATASSSHVVAPLSSSGLASRPSHRCAVDREYTRGRCRQAGVRALVREETARALRAA